MTKTILDRNLHITVYAIWLITCISLCVLHSRFSDDSFLVFVFMVYPLYAMAMFKLSVEIYCSYLKKSFPEYYFKYDLDKRRHTRRIYSAAGDCAAEITDEREKCSEQLVDISISYADTSEFLIHTWISLFVVLPIFAIILSKF